MSTLALPPRTNADQLLQLQDEEKKETAPKAAPKKEEAKSEGAVKKDKDGNVVKPPAPKAK